MLPPHTPPGNSLPLPQIPHVRCMDPLIPPSQLDSYTALMQEMRPCCNGDTTVDFRRFNAGLVGNDEVCAVCLEARRGLGAWGGDRRGGAWIWMDLGRSGSRSACVFL